MDEDFAETQWTPSAAEAYRRQAGQLIAAVEHHLELTLGREGRQVEVQTYFTSCQELRRAVDAFNDAEFDWCGSVPLALRFDGNDDEDEDDADQEDEDEEEEEEEEEAAVAVDHSAADVLSVLGRWDFRITDDDALMTAGRQAYLTAWQDDTEQDAEIRVDDASSAALELMHLSGLPGLLDAPGLELDRDITFAVRHEAEDQSAFEEDPFGLAAPD